MKVQSLFLVVLGLIASSASFADTTFSQLVHSRGDQFFCPSSFQGLPFEFADINVVGSPQRFENGCVISDKSSSCEITCHYQDLEIQGPSANLGSKGQQFFCPPSFAGRTFSRADVMGNNGAEQFSNGCIIPNKSASCTVACWYR